MRNLLDIESTFSTKEIDWFAERTNTTGTGLITFQPHVVDKYIKLTHAKHLARWEVRMEMQYMFSKYA